MSESVAISESEAARVKEHLKVYVMVFVALGVLTVVTVAISYLDLPTALAITVAMVDGSGQLRRGIENIG